MIQAIPLFSGSAGNALYVEVDHQPLLFDCGISLRKITKKLDLHGKSISLIHDCFITHSQHSDHFKGTPALVKKHRIPVHRPSEKVFPWDKPTFETECFVALPGGGSVLAVPANHDVPCCSYVVTDKRGNKLVYITDTGSILCDSLPYMMGANILIIEMNHEETILSNSSYNDELKKRVAKTHLNNVQATDLIELISWPGLKFIVPWHLSENNNSEEYVLKRLSAIELNNAKITFKSCTCL